MTGKVRNTTDDIEAKWGAGDWTTIKTGASGYFSGSLLSQSAGQGLLSVRLASNTAIQKTSSYVGIGDVFLLLGQSNPSGRGTSYQSYSHPTIKSTLFGNDNTWKELSDPTDSPISQVDSISIDSLASGSPWPILATCISSNQSIPVAFVPCAVGGKGITDYLSTASPLNRTTLYGSMNYRSKQLSGAKAILFWQGETDAIAGMASSVYNSYLDGLASAVFSDIGVKIMPCKLQNSTAIADANELEINTAIGQAWADNASVLTGPDFTDMSSDDSYHFTSTSKLETAASRWWLALKNAFY